MKTVTVQKMFRKTVDGKLHAVPKITLRGKWLTDIAAIGEKVRIVYEERSNRLVLVLERVM